ncbi:MAG: hypothetical protein HOG79_00295, partial [Prolixibacteraceae bacterium]|nr:hypothetical protein [Prolixibacteraceae bacterium]
LIQSTELIETVKWGGPAYTINGKNVVGVGSFKSYVALWFYQGALLQDNAKVLINAQENVTKALRQWRFYSLNEINDKLVLVYLNEAIENQKQNKEIKPDRRKPIEIPKELSETLNSVPELDNCFKKFPPGKQREFAEYISEAKRVETRLTRIKKITPLILQNIGLNDKYRK